MQELKVKALLICRNLGRLSPKEEVDEPDCNIVSNNAYEYKSDSLEISVSETSTYTSSGFYEDWFFSIRHNGQRVVNAANHYQGYHDPATDHLDEVGKKEFPGIYVAGEWEEILETFYKTAFEKTSK